jgi:hypothetical protein
LPHHGHLEIQYSQPLAILADELITPTKVTAFRNQSYCKPNLQTKEVITGKSRIYIRLALLGDPDQKFVTPAQMQEWWDFVSIGQASDILTRYFMQNTAHGEIPIAEQLDKMKFRFNFAKEEVENETFVEFEMALNTYFESHTPENSTTINALALIIEKKLPCNSQLQADYLQKKREELVNIHEDTPLLVIQRIKNV